MVADPGCYYRGSRPQLGSECLYPVAVDILSPEYGNSPVAGAVIAGNLAHLSQ
jgi:hypothetical protein